MFKRRSSSKENKDKAKEPDASAMGCVTGQNIPPKTFHPSQELQPLMQLLTELHERSGSAMDVLHSCCKDNQEIEEIIGNLSKELSVVKEQRDQEMLERWQLDEERKYLERELYEMEIELESERSNCFVLTEELREHDRLVAEQREDLLANQNYIEELNKRLKHLEREVYDMKIELKSERSNCFALTEELREHDRLVAEQSEDLLANQNYIEELNTRLKEHSRLVAGQIEDLLANQSYIEELNKRLKKELEQGEAVRREKQTLNDTLKGERKKNEELEGKVQEHSAFLSDLMRERESLQDQLSNLTDTVKRVTQKTANLEEDLVQVLQQFQGVGKRALDVSSSWTETFHSASLPPMSIPETLQLPVENLPDVSTELLMTYLGCISVKWYEFAHALGVGDVAANLQQMEQSPMRKCLQCLEAWIERGPEADCSWEKLLRVLNVLKLHAVAKDILHELRRRVSSSTL